MSSSRDFHIPIRKPAKKPAPNALNSESNERSTFNFVKSASNWQMKSFFDTPPSTLKDFEKRRKNILRFVFIVYTIRCTLQKSILLQRIMHKTFTRQFYCIFFSYRMVENVKSVSVSVHACNCVNRNAILSRMARTICAFFVDGRIPIKPDAAWWSFIGAYLVYKCIRKMKWIFFF